LKFDKNIRHEITQLACNIPAILTPQAGIPWLAASLGIGGICLAGFTALKVVRCMVAS
jgi:hypothetical protein